jgi:DNA-binding transcriptional LysR family regulator
VNLEVADIEAFVAVAEERSFTLAAARLYTTQQQLSAQIKRFERNLGVSLFVRTTRKLEPTSAANLLLAGAHDLLTQSSQWLAQASRLGTGNSGKVTIGYTQTCGYETLPAIAAAVRTESPDIVLVTRELYAADIESQVANHTIDLGLLRCPTGRPGTIQESLTHEPLMLAVATTHHLARRRRIALKEAATSKLSMWPRELIPGYFDACIALWTAAGGQSIHVSTTSTGTALWAKIVATFEKVCPPGIRLIALKDTSDVGVSLTWSSANRSPATDRVLEVARRGSRNNSPNRNLVFHDDPRRVEQLVPSLTAQH